jgi:hypothetical protein
MAKTNAGNFHRIHKNIFNQIEMKNIKYHEIPRTFSAIDRWFMATGHWLLATNRKTYN